MPLNIKKYAVKTTTTKNSNLLNIIYKIFIAYKILLIGKVVDTQIMISPGGLINR